MVYSCIGAKSLKMVQVKLFEGRHRDTDVESGLVDTVGDGEGGKN